MRDTADHAPAGQADEQAAAHPDIDTPRRGDDTPTPQATPDPVDEPRAARMPGGPTLAIASEAVTAAGAALYNTVGWMGLGLGGAALAGGAALVVGGVRRHRSPWRTRSWSTSSGTRKSGSASSGRTSGTGSGRKSARSGMPSLKGAGKGAGSRTGAGAGGRRAGAGGRARSAMPGRSGAGRTGARSRLGQSGTAARSAARRAASASGPALTGRAARRANRAAHNGLDRTADAATRNGRAARAATRAMREGGTARDAARAARASLRDSHNQPRIQHRWRRMFGAGLWAVTAFGAGVGYRLGGRALARTQSWIRVRRSRPPRPSDEALNRPRIDRTVDRPTTATRTRGADDMAKRNAGVPPFVAASEELAESFRRYEPPPGAGGMVQMYSDVGMLPDAFDQIAAGIGVFAERCRGELPLHPAVAELIGELAKVQAHMAGVSAEIKPAIERLHEPELDRARAPRPSEDRWDVGR